MPSLIGPAWKWIGRPSRREGLDRLALDDHAVLDNQVSPEADVDPNRPIDHRDCLLAVSRQGAKTPRRHCQPGHRIAGMASIPELGDGQVTWEVECLDRLYLNGYIGPVATSGGWVTFMREQRGKPIPSPGVLGQATEKFREAGKAMAERERIPLYPFAHKERKDEVANDFRRKRETRDGVVFVGVAQEKARAFQGKKIENKGIAWEGPGPRLLLVRRTGAVATDLRFAGTGGHRSGVPEMAGADAAARAGGRSSGR